MSEVAVKVANVSKRFKLYKDIVTGPLLELLCFWNRKRFFEEFYAVNDVSFEIRRGEVVGILGANGAGKTTLLKLVAGLLPIDRGHLVINGKVTALLALGVGVQPEMTGRENVLYGGLLVGMKKSEVLRKMNDIIAFSELGHFIDRPFRTYSSGMRARLLFSIAMSIDPDILIVDEALATGDTAFVRKCMERIHQLCRNGATILFVSHNTSHIEQLCDRAFLMSKGQIVSVGSPSEVVAEYNREAFENHAARAAASQTELIPIDGDGRISITDIALRNAAGDATQAFYSGEPMAITIDYVSNLSPHESEVTLFVGFLRLPSGEYIGEINTRFLVERLGSSVSGKVLTVDAAGSFELRLDPLLLLNNHYSLWVVICDKQGNTRCEYRNVKPFFVARRQLSTTRGPIFWQPCEIITTVEKGSG